MTWEAINDLARNLAVAICENKGVEYAKGLFSDTANLVGVIDDIQFTDNLEGEGCLLIKIDITQRRLEAKEKKRENGKD